MEDFVTYELVVKLKEKEYIKKYYWSKKNKLWSDSYFISTVGAISEDKVIDYIKNQG